MKTLLNKQALSITLQRLAHQLIEDWDDCSQVVFIGIQPRGIWLSDRIVGLLRAMNPSQPWQYGKLDITFYRDDVLQSGSALVPNDTDLNFDIEGKTVILMDDVLHTGRTIRSAMDAIMDIGRPARIELLALIDRHYSREIPIQPDYVGRTIDTVITQRVKVLWEEKDGEDKVLLIDQAGNSIF